LGRSGAWAAVFVSFFTFVLSFFIMGRLKQRFLSPLEDLHQVLLGAQQGEHLRRCKLGDSPAEVRQVLDAVNELLDQQLCVMSKPPGEGRHEVESVALVELLEQKGRAAVLLDRQGDILRANNAALEILAKTDAKVFKEAFAELGQAGRLPEEQRIEALRLKGESGWLCFWPPQEVAGELQSLPEVK
jgi:PAS domain-containing protein